MKFLKTTLGNISIDNKGSYGIAASAVDYSEDLYTYLRITDISDDGRLNLSELKSVDDDNAKKYLLKPNDIVFARTGASTGRNYFYDGKFGKFVYAGFLIKFSIDEKKVNPRFIKYYCQSPKYYDWIKSYNTGSTRGNINAQTYANMEIELPPRDYQNSVVKILDSLDDKIELNNRINKNLEEQAMAIYKDIILDNKKLQSAVLSDIANITMGQSPNGKSYNEVGDGEVFYQGRADFGYRYPTRRLYTTEPQRMAKANDILISVRAPVGDINVAFEECCIGRGLASIRSKYSTPSFLLYTMVNLKKNLDVFNGEGTIFGSINRDSLNGLKIDIPDNDVISKFELLVSPIDKKILNNYCENVNLSSIRDSLLPRLMNGEINVSKVPSF